MQNDKAKFKTEFGKRVYHFALATMRFLDDCPRDGAATIISNQLVRSSTSVGANMVEAQAASSKKDYVNFFTIALKSANESKYWISLLRDARKVDQDKANALLKEATEIANVLASSVLTMKGRK